MYSFLCSCMKVQSFCPKSTFVFLNKAGPCCQNFRYYSGQDDTHYDVLEVKKNSSPKEIRSAFIRLSKEFHPDKNPKNPLLHDKFVQLNEAYSTLNDIDSRRNYDASLNLKEAKRRIFVYRTENPGTSERPEFWKDYYDFEAQMKKNEAIYIPKFLHKITQLSRAALVLVLIAVAAGAMALQVGSVFISKALPQEIMLTKEMEIAQNLMNAKNDAKKFGLQENIERFQKRFEESQHPPGTGV
uniref:DnaJ-like protein 60 n=2 Tax=Cacopsylla melanoneura TaxID=428564 RepID=A0A8D8UE15_9HEMI